MAETLVPAGTWNVDTSHSALAFRIRYLGILDVNGRFTQFEGTVDASDPASPSTTITAQTASIDTGFPQRDEHLRNADFFDAEANPTVVFASKGVTANADGTFAVAGELTLHGATNPVTLTATATGTGTDPWGQSRAAVHATGTIDRGNDICAEDRRSTRSPLPVGPDLLRGER